MSKKNKNVPAPEQENEAVKQPKKKKKSGFGRFLGRFFLLLFTIILILAVDLYLVLNLVFNGPSEAASKSLTMSLTEISLTKWVPDIFLGADRVAEIRNDMKVELSSAITDPSKVTVNPEANVDSVRIENRSGDTFQAHIMLVRDPSQVYMGLASQDLATSGGKTPVAMMEAEANAVAAINAGAFQVDEASGRAVAAGLIYSAGQKSWDENHNLVDNKGFAGFNQDGVLIVATDMTAAEAEVQGIRDGCSFGPVLIVNGEVNADAYNTNSGYASRTAIGQRADGTVIFVTIDGLQAGSLGANYQDLIDILMEYGAVNACNMNGGSSVMMYRDAGQIRMINNQSLLNTQESSMPNYWMVRATGKE